MLQKQRRIKPQPRRYYLPTAFDEEPTILQKVNKMGETFNQLADGYNDVVDYVEGYDEELKTKEDKENLTSRRKLSPTGNFTGLLNGKSIPSVFSEIQSNEDKIQYLTSQFSDGQTGLVIDCGFFNDEEVKKYYDGGVF